MNHKHLFIGGLHRSGTSLLFKCLRDHPQISGFSGTGAGEDEGQHLQTVFQPAFKHGGPERFGFDPEAHLTESSPLVTPENRQKLHAEWGRHWDLSKPVLLEKSPPNLIRTRFLQEMFGESYFLIIRRHPIAYAYPRKKRDERLNVYALVKHWLACHDIFEQDRPYLRNCLVIQYEDFVGDPGGHLDRISEWIGIGRSTTKQTVLNDINRKYFAGWLAMQNRFLFWPYTKVVTSRFEKQVREKGYSLVHLGGES